MLKIKTYFELWPRIYNMQLSCKKQQLDVGGNMLNVSIKRKFGDLNVI